VSKQGAWKARSGLIATQVDPVGNHGRHRLTKRRYVATFGPADEVGLPLLWQGERQRALALLQSLRPMTRELLPPLEDAIRYLETLRDLWPQQNLHRRREKASQ
jgi:hypothetical protein